MNYPIRCLLRVRKCQGLVGSLFTLCPCRPICVFPDYLRDPDTVSLFPYCSILFGSVLALSGLVSRTNNVEVPSSLLLNFLYILSYLLVSLIHFVNKINNNDNLIMLSLFYVK